MTQDEINKMVYEFLPYPSDGQHYALKQFAKLVAEHERKACAYRAGIALLGADRGLANRVDQAILGKR
jgi:hypothetical protein